MSGRYVQAFHFREDVKDLSLMPSLRYSSAFSGLMLAKGKTAMDFSVAVLGG